MPYQKEQFQGGDLVRQDWANKLEDNLERLWHIKGVISDSSQLPDTPEEGDVYFLTSEQTFYIYVSGNWIGQHVDYPNVRAKVVRVTEDYTTAFGDRFVIADAGNITISLGAALDGMLITIINKASDKITVDNNGTIYDIKPNSQMTFLYVGGEWLDYSLISNGGGGLMGYVQNNLHFDLTETYKQYNDETPNGAVDGSNTTFTLLNPPIWPGTLSITVDDSTNITDNGDGTLSDGGTVNYETGEFTLSAAPSSITVTYHQQYWDGIKYQPIALGEDFPATVEVIYDIGKSQGIIKTRVRIYDMDDTLLLDSTPIEVTEDRQTVRYQFDVSSLTKPNTIVAQLEVLCDPNADGFQDFIETRWY